MLVPGVHMIPFQAGGFMLPFVVTGVLYFLGGLGATALLPSFVGEVILFWTSLHCSRLFNPLFLSKTLQQQNKEENVLSCMFWWKETRQYFTVP